MARVESIVSATAFAALVGCSNGGDGVGSSDLNVAQGPFGASAPSFVSAPVYDYFGVVNGAEPGWAWHDQCRLGTDPSRCYERVTVDGVPASADAIQTGHIVRVRSTSGWNVAVDVQHAVVGTVQAVDQQAGIVTILGQRVRLYTAPAWQDEPLAVGDRVSISGFLTTAGDINPTRIDAAHHTADALRGVLQREGSGFRIGALAVDLAAATASGFPAGAVLPGDAVRIVGRLEAQGERFTATAIEYIGGDFPAPGTTVWELQGFVTAARTAADFDVAGMRALVGNCNCAWFPAPLPVGAPVSVRAGSTATGLTIVSPGPNTDGHRLIGPIEGIDAVAGTLTVLGFTAQLQDTTFILGADTRLSTWGTNPGAIALGEWVVLVVQRVGDQLLAPLITRPLNNVPSIDTWGVQLEDPVIRVLGQPIVTDASTTLAYCDGVCGYASVRGFFDATIAPYTYLGIYLESAEPPLRAIRIHLD